MDNKRINTICVHGVRDNNNITGAITVPVYQSATFTHPGVGQSTGYDYSRLQNPTREALEKTVALLEGGTDAMAFSSGMAAMAVLCELFCRVTISSQRVICMAVPCGFFIMWSRRIPYL